MDQEIQIQKERLCILVIGMAGTGKTTFVKQLDEQLKVLNRKHFIVNLDPAVYQIPYTPNIDIRNHINYKELMTKNKLGPNGAIMTALNLYCLQLNSLLDQIENLSQETEIVIVDTPGQIEAFTWSASGSIIAQTFSTSMPTIIVYVIDIARCQNPNTLMSNLLFCCSIFYKMKLPLVVAFNKCDVSTAQKPLEWIQNYELFQEALTQRGNYLSTLNKQMALTMEEFYQNFNKMFINLQQIKKKIAQISALSGFGFDNIIKLIGNAKQEYFDITLPDIKANINERKQLQFEQSQIEYSKIYKDQQKQTTQGNFHVQMLNKDQSIQKE